MRTYEDDESVGTQKNNTKTSAASPLPRGLAEQGSVGKASKLTAAAKNLGITESLTSIPDNVKEKIIVFSDVAIAIDKSSSVNDSKKAVNAYNLAGWTGDGSLSCVLMCEKAGLLWRNLLQKKPLPILHILPSLALIYYRPMQKAMPKI